jgi:hypothetical protein
MFVFDKPSGAGAFVPALTYQARVLDDGGIIADIARSIVVYLDVTSVAEPSLLCACDAYKATVLYNVIPE